MRWAERVRRALADPSISTGIAAVVAGITKTHIDRNYGRGQGGSNVPHLPLKPVYGMFWTRRPKLGQDVRKKRKVGGKRSKAHEYLVVEPGYRNGGQPLRDTGHLFRSLNASGLHTGGRIQITLRGPAYAKYQDRGFKTSKPNYIPLTKKGKRQHGTGNDPATEGLKRNKDFFMAWKGVTVPARPFLLPTRSDMREVGKSVFLGLRSVLRRF